MQRRMTSTLKSAPSLFLWCGMFASVAFLAAVLTALVSTTPEPGVAGVAEAWLFKAGPAGVATPTKP